MDIYKIVYESIVESLVGQRATELDRVAKKLQEPHQSETSIASGKALERIHRIMMLGAALSAEIEGQRGQRIYVMGKHYEWSGFSWDVIDAG